MNSEMAYYDNDHYYHHWRSDESTRLPPMRPRFDSRSRRHKWVEFALVLSSASRVFLRVLRFSPLIKNQHTADSSWL